MRGSMRRDTRRTLPGSSRAGRYASPVRVLHVQKARGVGGSERHLLDLLAGLPSQDVDPRMLVLRAPGAGRFTAALERRGIDYVNLDAGPDVNPALVERIRREIRNYGADLVHTHLVHADLHGQLAARLAGVPAIASMHGAHPFFGREPIRTAEHLALRSARRVIAISHHVSEFLLRHRLAAADRIRVVRYGIDSDKWLVSEEERSAARSRWDVEEGTFVIGLVSRLVDGKGHHVSFEATLRAHSTEPKIRLIVAGTGPLVPELREIARTSDGVIRMVGFVDDIRDLMAACDVILVPTADSFGEGFGLAALEAMGAGRPVIVTAVASLPEVVGEAGIVVPPEDADPLADAIVILARDPDQVRLLADAGLVRTRDEFALGTMVAHIAALYGEVVG
jgi:glycosyltransferase involved in cell wall biosynthesis